MPSTVIREISLLTEFKHPNIVKLIDVIIEDRRLLVILEYIDNDLRQYLNKMDVLEYLSPL